MKNVLGYGKMLRIGIYLLVFSKRIHHRFFFFFPFLFSSNFQIHFVWYQFSCWFLWFMIEFWNPYCFRLFGYEARTQQHVDTSNNLDADFFIYSRVFMIYDLYCTNTFDRRHVRCWTCISTVQHRNEIKFD